MSHQIDWPHILIQCKNRVLERLTPLLTAVDGSKQNLGIGAGGDPIKQVDLRAEAAIIDTLEEHKISFTLISEESGLKRYGKNPNECYVTADPIDGTTNLIRGISFYATSIAVSTKPQLRTVHSGLVADLVHDVKYIAEKGKGAYRNNMRISPSKSTSLEEAVIGIDLNSYKAGKIAPRLTSLIKNTKHIRHFGANALELCYVADGTTDGFIDIRGKLRATDFAAAWLIMQEAGARITSPEGKSLDIRLDPRQKLKFVAAGNTGMLEIMLGLMRLEKETE